VFVCLCVCAFCLQVAGFQYHRMLVRDCSWHPYEPELATVSWDGTVVTWGVTPAPGKAMLAGDCHDMYDY
jgi:WD repeat-containing protein 23